MANSHRLVLDSSVIIKWLNRQEEENLSQSDKLLDELEIGKIFVFVPHLAMFEIGNALLKGKRLSLPEARLAFE